jgi:hypothetical protein
MSKKLERILRDRPVTPDQAASDAIVRLEVEGEFPPARAVDRKGAVGVTTSLLSEGLKRAIRESGRSIDEIAQEAGVSPILIGEFVAGSRDIRMGTADALADVLGLNLVGS